MSIERTIIGDLNEEYRGKVSLKEGAPINDYSPLVHIGCRRDKSRDFEDDGTWFQVYYYDPDHTGDKRIEVTKASHIYDGKMEVYIGASSYEGHESWYYDELNGVSVEEVKRGILDFKKAMDEKLKALDDRKREIQSYTKEDYEELKSIREKIEGLKTSIEDIKKSIDSCKVLTEGQMRTTVACLDKMLETQKLVDHYYNIDYSYYIK